MVRKCGTGIIHHKGKITSKLNIEQIKKKATAVQDDGQTYYIGVVTHVMYENPNVALAESDAAYSIETLNQDFNKRATNFNNGETVYENTQFEATYNDYVSRADAYKFVFYQVDIIYKPIPPITNEDTQDAIIKGASPPVKPNLYLNVYIAELDYPDPILGYATFPWEFDPDTDGVVINRIAYGQDAIPPFDLNKTLSHEVGHWIGLFHTFEETQEEYGGGDFFYMVPRTPFEAEQLKKGDLVPDTPPQAEPTFGNPYDDPSTWPTTQPADEDRPFRAMFMDMMDYTDDINLFMFTHDQVLRGRQAIRLYRPDIANNPICVGKFTKILMADSTEKEIWQVKRGDLVFGDLNKSVIHKVAKVIRRVISGDTNIRMVKIAKESLAAKMPNCDLLITASHPIVWDNARIRSKYFSQWHGVTFYPSIEASQILPAEADEYALYDLVFEDNSYYIANGVLVQSHSPCFAIEPLEDKEYFSNEKCIRNKNGECPDYTYPIKEAYVPNTAAISPKTSHSSGSFYSQCAALLAKPNVQKKDMIV